MKDVYKCSEGHTFYHANLYQNPKCPQCASQQTLQMPFSDAAEVSAVMEAVIDAFLKSPPVSSPTEGTFSSDGGGDFGGGGADGDW